MNWDRTFRRRKDAKRIAALEAQNGMLKVKVRSLERDLFEAKAEALGDVLYSEALAQVAKENARLKMILYTCYGVSPDTKGGL